MPELDNLTIAGFKSIAHLDALRLNPINVIIGPNGSGKSNLIGAFAFLNAIRQGRLQEYVAKEGGADRMLHFGSKVTQVIKLGLSFEDGMNQYRIELEPTVKDELVPTAETVYFWDKASYSRPYSEALSPAGKEARISVGPSSRVANYVRGHLDKWRIYHFHDTGTTSPMKRAADVNDNRSLRSDASNLASFLFLLQEQHPIEFDLIRRSIQRVAPFFDDFVLEPQRLNPSKIGLEWRHTKHDAYFDAASFSDGTLRFVALATLFLQPREYRPSVILVDEPELGLHPYAVTMLASLMKSAAEQESGGSQVVVSTQSSLLLDHFEPEDVVVADLVDGATEFTRLESERLASWLEEYSLGQLWEKNEFGGRPRR